MNDTINVTVVSPFTTGPTRGNMTTVRRITDHLQKSGCRATLLRLDCMDTLEQHKLLDRRPPDLLHAFHAYYAAPTARSLALEYGIPYVVTITGSDLFDPELLHDASTVEAIQDAAAVTCFDPLISGHLAEAFPEVADRIAVIPQGVLPLPLNETFPRGIDEFIVLLPAAIRPVKGISEAIEAIEPLTRDFPALRLLLAGGVLDHHYAAAISAMAATLPWLHLLGEVPHHRMGPLFAASDLVLNCSLFEGGMANTLLEAMIMSKPVLARNVLGNRSLISDGVTGWLYDDDRELRERLRTLLLNPGMGIETGKAGRIHVAGCCSAVSEAERYREIYERLLAANPPAHTGDTKT